MAAGGTWNPPCVLDSRRHMLIEPPRGAGTRRIPINLTRGTVSAALGGYVRHMQHSLDRKLDALARSVTPASVHACRTQTRRLRALLRIFKRAFRPALLARYQIALRHLTRDLGTVRDADVEQEVISRLAQDQSLLALAAHRRSRAVRELEAKMRDEAWRRRVEGLRRAASDPKLIVESGLPMAAVTARIVARRRRRLRRQLRAGKRSPRALHKIRLKVKSLRYLLECCASDQAVVAELKQLRVLQDRLGEFHDEWCLQRGLAHDPRYLRASVDICARLKARRAKLLHDIEKNQIRLLRIWEEVPLVHTGNPRDEGRVTEAKEEFS